MAKVLVDKREFVVSREGVLVCLQLLVLPEVSEFWKNVM